MSNGNKASKNQNKILRATYARTPHNSRKAPYRSGAQRRAWAARRDATIAVRAE